MIDVVHVYLGNIRSFERKKKKKIKDSFRNGGGVARTHQALEM